MDRDVFYDANKLRITRDRVESDQSAYDLDAVAGIESRFPIAETVAGVGVMCLALVIGGNTTHWVRFGFFLFAAFVGFCTVAGVFSQGLVIRTTSGRASFGSGLLARDRAAVIRAFIDAKNARASAMPG